MKLNTFRLAAALLACGLFAATAHAQYPLQTIGSILPATQTGTLDATDEAVTLDTLGYPGVAIQLTGTWTGTVTFEVSIDGVTYDTLNMRQPDGNTDVTSATGNGMWSGSIIGFRYVRARFSTASSGAVIPFIRATFGGGSGGSATLEGAELSVGAQPESDPHYVRCSNGTIAAACDVSVTALPNEGQQTMANSISVAVASNQSAIPVSATDLDVQSGGADILSTTAFNAAFGTAGSADTQVMSVQGIASMTPFLVNPGTAANWGVYAEDSAHSSTQAGIQIFGVRQDSQADFGADGDYVPFSINDAGELRVAFSGAAGGTSLADDGDVSAGTTAATPVSGFYQSSVTACTDGDGCIVGITAQRTLKATLFTAAGVEIPAATTTEATHATTLGTITSVVGNVLMGNASTATPTDVGADGDAAAIWLTRTGAVNIADGGGSITVDGTVAVSGTVTVGSHAVTNAGTFAVQVDGNALTALQLIDDSLFADDAAFTIATSKVSMAGFTVDESSTDSADEGDAVAARTTPDRLLYTVPAASTASAQAAVECAIVSAASNNATNCKAAAGNFYGVDIINTTTTTYYLRLYNTSSSPTCSSATGFIRSIPIPPAAASGQAGGLVRISPIAVNYATGISYCLTGGASSTDNTNAATGIYGAVLYK